MITNLAAFVQSPQRKAAFALYLALCTVLSASAQEPTFTTFDVPGSIGTSPSSINPRGGAGEVLCAGQQAREARLQVMRGTGCGLGSATPTNHREVPGQ